MIDVFKSPRVYFSGQSMIFLENRFPLFRIML